MYSHVTCLTVNGHFGRDSRVAQTLCFRPLSKFKKGYIEISDKLKWGS